MKFLQGTARIRNVANLVLIGVGPEDSKIQCEGPAGLYSKQMVEDNLTTSNLMSSNCGAEPADDLPCDALIENTVNLTTVIVKNSTGYGLLGFNLLGNPLITDSMFRYNRAPQDCTVMVVVPSLVLLHSSQFALLNFCLVGKFMWYLTLWALESLNYVMMCQYILLTLHCMGINEG